MNNDEKKILQELAWRYREAFKKITKGIITRSQEYILGDDLGNDLNDLKEIRDRIIKIMADTAVVDNLPDNDVKKLLQNISKGKDKFIDFREKYVTETVPNLVEN